MNDMNPLLNESLMNTSNGGVGVYSTIQQARMENSSLNRSNMFENTKLEEKIKEL